VTERTTERFRAMGCEVVVAGASAAKFAAIERLFAERERTFSRFLADTELNRVNRAAGRAVCVSESFAAMLQLALDGAKQTSGLVDPTVGAALSAAGYNADFASLRDDGRVPGAGIRCTWRSVRLAGRYMHMPRGTVLDLNGVVKGQTVDDAVALLSGSGWVSAGGDLATRGETVVGLPAGGSVRLVDSALATSGRDRRVWLRGGRLQHHLIDPATGLPSTSPWQQVTVCASSCVGADIAAKAAFLLGDRGPRWLDAVGIPGRFITDDGTVRLNESWHTNVELAAACI
jgi:thiamine biosynthesis lipoprotein